MNNLNKLYKLMDQLGLFDIVDLDNYCYHNPNSEIAKVYSSLSEEEYERFLEDSDKQVRGE